MCVCVSVCVSVRTAQALTLPSMISQRLVGVAVPVELRRASNLASRPSCHSLNEAGIAIMNRAFFIVSSSLTLPPC